MRSGDELESEDDEWADVDLEDENKDSKASLLKEITSQGWYSGYSSDGGEVVTTHEIVMSFANLMSEATDSVLQQMCGFITRVQQ